MVCRKALPARGMLHVRHPAFLYQTCILRTDTRCLPTHDLQCRLQQGGCLRGNADVARSQWAENSSSTRSGLPRAPQRPKGPGTAGSAGRAAPPPASCLCRHSARIAERGCLLSLPRERASPRPLPAEDADWEPARLQHHPLGCLRRAPETRRGRAPRSPRTPLSGWRRGCPQPSRRPGHRCRRHPGHRCRREQGSPILPGPQTHRPQGPAAPRHARAPQNPTLPGPGSTAAARPFPDPDHAAPPALGRPQRARPTACRARVRAARRRSPRCRVRAQPARPRVADPRRAAARAPARTGRGRRAPVFGRRPGALAGQTGRVSAGQASAGARVRRCQRCVACGAGCLRLGACTLLQGMATWVVHAMTQAAEAFE